MTPEERKKKIERIQRIERIRALEGQQSVASPETTAVAQPKMLGRSGISEEQFGQIKSDVSQAWTQPSATLQKGLYQMFPQDRAANPLAGLANVGLAGAQTLAAVPASVLAVTRQMPFIGDVQRPIESLLGGAGEAVASPVRGFFKAAYSPFLGEEGAQELAEPVGEVANMGTQALVTAGVAKGAGALRPSNILPKIESGALTMGMRALKAGDNLASREAATKLALSDPNISITKEGLAQAQGRQQTLQGVKESNLVQPATARGDLYSVNPIRQKLKDLQSEFRKSGGRTLRDERIVEQVAEKLEEIVSREGQQGEFLTPQRLEVFKEELNSLLQKDFQRERRGQPTELQPTKKQAMMEEVGGARGILEEKLPGIRDLNLKQQKWIDVKNAIDDVLYEMSGGAVTRPVGLVSALGGNLAGGLAVALSESVLRPPARFNIAGKAYRGARKLQGKGAEPAIPSFQSVPEYTRVPASRQLNPPPIQAGFGEPRTQSNPPFINYGAVGQQPKRLGGGSTTAGGAIVPPLPMEAPFTGQTQKMGVVELVWDKKKQMYVEKRGNR